MPISLRRSLAIMASAATLLGATAALAQSGGPQKMGPFQGHGPAVPPPTPTTTVTVKNGAGVVIRVCYQFQGGTCEEGKQLALGQSETHTFSQAGNNNIVNVFYYKPLAPTFSGASTSSGWVQYPGCYFKPYYDTTVSTSGTLYNLKCSSS